MAERHEICAVALGELFRGDGEILASPIGVLPGIGARLARLTHSPDLLMTDGVASLVDVNGQVEGWMPYRRVFDVVWSGRRHVIMGASQIDRYGNQNIACIGPFYKPKAQLLGMRGAPGNTVNHPTSYWIPNHTKRVFVEKVDVVSGIGWDRGCHEIRRVVTNLAVLDFTTPDHRMRLASVHPGVTVADVIANTGFELVVDDVATTREPTEEELRLLHEVVDPDARGKREIPS